jgi:carboxymethylenebutenolidase
MKAAILVLASLAGCASKSATPVEQKKVEADPSQPPSGISEEQFKALHVHTTEAAPPAKGETIQIGSERAYLSLPKDRQAPLPAVIVIHEWWGLNENVMHWADRLAAEGYAALAVDLYQGKATKDPNEAMELMKSVDRSKALNTLSAAHAFVAEDERIRATKRASIGWCFGGGWSLHASLALPMDATVIYYGHLTEDPQELKLLEGPVLGVFGNRDQGIPPSAVNAFEEALKSAQVPHQILRFDADHAFANPSNARYDQAASAQAWAEVQKFLAANLK